MQCHNSLIQTLKQSYFTFNSWKWNNMSQSWVNDDSSQFSWKCGVNIKKYKGEHFEVCLGQEVMIARERERERKREMIDV